MTQQRFRNNQRILVGALASVLLTGSLGNSFADTLESALARAYVANPTLNAQRANVRATDENVPRAKGIGRPRVNATADVSRTFTEFQQRDGQSIDRAATPRGVGLQVDQTLFNGFQTENSIRQAESQVLGARETLRNSEQTVLFNAATSYMDVLRDTAILSLQRNNVEVLEEQLRQTRDRFAVGEVTRTDVAQAESRLAGARSQASAAEANLRTSIAVFRQVVGSEPRQLAPGRPLDRLLPPSLDTALKIGLAEHPAIIAALHGVDAALLNVRVVEGQLFPQIGLSGSLTQRNDVNLPGDKQLAASIGATLTVPLYEGGQVYAQTRQAKETAGQARFQADVIRDQVRAAVISAWGQLESARAQILAAQAQVEASETALAGVREEARVGQRTTLDVLNAQQELLNARVNLITAQRDRVVASYAVVQAIGRLTSRTLALKVEHYSPKLHYDQVKDAWGGLTTPSGQ